MMNIISKYKDFKFLNEANNNLKSKIPPEIYELQKKFKKNNFKLFLVGGAVRDSLMDKEPKDFDLATDATPDQVTHILKDYKLLNIGKAFGIVVVVIGKEQYEIATFRNDVGKGRRPDHVQFTTIENDVKRRDLTINALFYDLEKDEIVDLVGGINDITKKVINTVGDADLRFDEDPLRKLRAIRFTARLGSKLQPNVEKSLIKNNTLTGVSAERIIDELKAGLKNAKSVKRYFLLLDKFNFYPLILPGLKINVKNIYNSKCFEIVISSIIDEKYSNQISHKLLNLKYNKQEIKNISYLLKLKDMKIDDTYKMKLEQKNINLVVNEMKKFGIKFNSNKKLIKIFFDKYNITTDSNNILAKGFKGPEIGVEIKNTELQKIKKLL